jgi:hypothetical protein
MLRPRLGARLADAAVDIVKTAELMGHQSILTTRRYMHAADEGKRCDSTVGELSLGELPQICHKRKAAGLIANRNFLKRMARMVSQTCDPLVFGQSVYVC